MTDQISDQRASQVRCWECGEYPRDEYDCTRCDHVYCVGTCADEHRCIRNTRKQ